MSGTARARAEILLDLRRAMFACGDKNADEDDEALEDEADDGAGSGMDSGSGGNNEGRGVGMDNRGMAGDREEDDRREAT